MTHFIPASQWKKKGARLPKNIKIAKAKKAASKVRYKKGKA